MKLATLISPFVAVIVLAVTPAHSQTKVLGEAPLCEASAVLRLPCGERECLVVGDNEVRDRLYEFPILHQDLEAEHGRELLLGAVEISDVESLVDLGSNRILVMGSHSRKKDCDAKKNRRRFLVAEHSESELKVVGETVQTEEISCASVFEDAAHASEVLSAVCKAIDESEQRANSIFGALASAGAKATVEACGQADPFNIEGAVAIPAPGGPEVWVGLRGPLVEKHGAPRRFSVMSRMKTQKKLTFDAAALVDLDGFAIRELTMGGGWVWGIAGPPEDSAAAFKLWRFPIRSLAPNATIRPEFIAELPTSSEGLALLGATAFVVIDGDKGDDDEKACITPARYQTIRVPN